MSEPVPPRHRRRERRRFRPTPAQVPPDAPGGTPGKYGTPPATPRVEAPPPVEEPAAGRSPAGPATGRAPQTAGGPPADERGRTGGRARSGRRGDVERGLRGIVGAGPSQVGVVGAMRARDAARPTAEDMAAAERDLVVVRRHYVPPDTGPHPPGPSGAT